MSWQSFDFGAAGTTLIDGANIYAGTILGTAIKADEITGSHIKAGAIATSHLAFSLVGSDNVVATINASTEGIKINAAKLTLTGLLQVGGAAADINAGATTIDGGKITADSLDATKIKAASITTDKLAVGTVQRDNLLTNGHFGTYNTYGDNYRGWTLVSGTFAPTYGTYRPGGTTTDLWVPCISASVTSGLQLLSQRVTVVPGRAYTLAGMLYHTAGRAGIRVCAVGGNELSNTWSAGVSAGTNVPVFYQNATLISNGQASSDVANRWNLYAYRVTIPNGVTQVDIQICAWLTGDVNVFPGFIQFYDDDINEATGSVDLVNQMKNVAFGGDIQGNYTSIAVRGLQGRLVSSAAPSHAHVLGWHSTNNQWQSLPLTDWLGYTPVNKAGDTLSGQLTSSYDGGWGSGGAYRVIGTLDMLIYGSVNNNNTRGSWDIASIVTSGVSYDGLWFRNGSTGAVAMIRPDGGIVSPAAVSASQFNGSGAGLTGTAASLTAGNATYAASAGNADTVDGVHASAIARVGAWSDYAFEANIDLNALIYTQAPRFIQAVGRANAPSWQNGDMAYTWMSAGGDVGNRGIQWYADTDNIGWRERSNNVWKRLWDSNNFNPDLKANLTSPSFNTSITTPTAYVGDLVIGYGNEIDHSSGADIYIGARTTANVYIGQSKICLAPADGSITTSFPGSSLVPAGSTNTYGGLHFKGVGSDKMVGITSSADSSGTQGGVMIQGGGAYGTRIRFFTTNSYAQGMKLSWSILEDGTLTSDRGGWISYPAAYWGSATLRLNSSTWSPGSQVAQGEMLSTYAGDTKFMFHGNQGAMSVYADGYFYQNEGQYRVLDTSGGTLSGDLVGTTMQGNFRVYSSPTDKIDGSPWYGLGASMGVDLSVGLGASATHLAGYYGLRLRSADNIIDIFRTDYNVHSTLKTSIFYSRTPATTGSYYQSAAIQIREVGTVGAAQSSHAYAPKIGFHWAGRADGNLVFDSSGTYRFMDGDCNAHYSVCASAFWGSIKPGGTGNVSLDEGNNRALRVSTAGYGYVDIGPQNTSWCHYSTDRPAHWFNTAVHVQGDIRCYESNTRMHAYGVDVHAWNGAGLKLWNGADGYSITMNNYNSSGYAGDAYDTGGADYNMVLRMDGVDAPRGGGDHLARGFMFRNNSLNGTYAHLAPFGNYTCWGGMLALRDVGNNSWYGLYFYNGVMYMKKLA